MRFLPSLLLLISSIATASPINGTSLAKRGSYLHPGSHTAVIQWTSDSGRLNNLRNYHIDHDTSYVMESRRTSADSSWTTTSTGIKARSGGPLVAGVYKLSDNKDDVEIRLFCQNPNQKGYDEETEEPTYRMSALVWRPNAPWRVDEQFYNDIGFIAFPQAVVNWKDSKGIPQWRMYFISSATGDDWSWMGAAMNLYGEGTNPIMTYSMNSVFEAALSGSGKWSIGASKKRLAHSQQPLGYTGSVAAVAWKGGSRISVIYWDTDGLDDFEIRPGVIREVRWNAEAGQWIEMERPNKDFKNFSPTGSLAAIGWKDASNVDQLRLYVKWVDELKFPPKLRMVEFQAGANGWGRQSDDLPDFFIKGTHSLFPITAVAWTYPDPGKVHIRMHFPKCWLSGSGLAWGCIDAQEARAHEVVYDTGLGWRDGGDID